MLFLKSMHGLELELNRQEMLEKIDIIMLEKSKLIKLEKSNLVKPVACLPTCFGLNVDKKKASGFSFHCTRFNFLIFSAVFAIFFCSSRG